MRVPVVHQIIDFGRSDFPEKGKDIERIGLFCVANKVGYYNAII
jgi:hypothetical protein